MKHYKIQVRGKVQGVFYRKSTKEAAEFLGVKGWVKNLPDGSVQIEAQGEGQSLLKLVEWCQKGPKNAVVKGVEVKELRDEPISFSSFEVVN